MSNLQATNIKETVLSAGYQLHRLQSNSSGKETEEYRLNRSTTTLEIHFFPNSNDAIRAVAEHAPLLSNIYLRQVAIGKLWVILKGDPSSKDEIDRLMDAIVAKA